MSDVILANALTKLAIARGGRLDDAIAEVYLNGLGDLDAEVVARACDELGKQKRPDYETLLPELGIIRERVASVIAAHEAAHARARQQLRPPASEEDPRTWYTCHACRDSGFREVHCAGGSGRSCGRSSKGEFVTASNGRSYFQGACQTPHPHVRRCDCRPIDRRQVSVP